MPQIAPMRARRLSVTEYESLRVLSDSELGKPETKGLREAEFTALCRFNEQNKHKLFTVGHRKITFMQFVGVLQIGSLTIEIFPKLAKDVTGDKELDHTRWQKLLVHMLRVCRKLPLELGPKTDLREGNVVLTDLFFGAYLDALAPLLHHGLTRRYHQVAGNQLALKGKLLFGQHVRHNAVHQERFYVQHQVYDHTHLLNQVLMAALYEVRTRSTNANVRAQAQHLSLLAPEVPLPQRITPEQLDSIQLNRKTESHHEALALARLILLSLSPTTRTGQQPLLAILFNMNRLWEEYVFRSLKRTDVSVTAHNRKPFWYSCAENATRWSIESDLLITRDDGSKLLIDTKWKHQPITERPSIQDLRQMYAYNHYFGAEDAFLLYPTAEAVQYVNGSFVEPGSQKPGHTRCHLAWWPLFPEQDAEPGRD